MVSVYQLYRYILSGENNSPVCAGDIKTNDIMEQKHDDKTTDLSGEQDPKLQLLYYNPKHTSKQTQFQRT